MDLLAERLCEAGVRHVVLDGRVTQKKRVLVANVFEFGREGVDGQTIPGMLISVDSMSEGHSFHCCNNIILIAYSWAYNKFKQFLDRVHRLVSEKPINVYILLTHGTIDRKLESLVQDKSNASDLVLDGCLMGERSEDINFAELLAIARSDFDPQHATVPETRMAADWSVRLSALTAAQLAWETAAAPCRDRLTDSNLLVPTRTKMSPVGPVVDANKTDASPAEIKALLAGVIPVVRPQGPAS